VESPLVIKTAKDWARHCAINIGSRGIKRNVVENLKLGLPEARPYEVQDKEIMLLAGGPSLPDFEQDIREKRQGGMPLVTVNGAYNWCVEKDIAPSMQVVVDGREFNKRFVLPHVPGCKYMLASQSNPEIVKAAPPDQTILWHAGSSEAVKKTLEDYDAEREEYREWFPVMGGSTVMLRTIPLLIMLGYRKYHIFGWDSCLRGDMHHAYSQPENDGKHTIPVRVNGKEFHCQMWMWMQAQEFIDIQQMIAEHCQMEVYGDGLIAELIKEGARHAGF
jgi:hypothetical protein